MDSSVVKDPNFWQFLETIWIDHSFFFMVLAFWTFGVIGCKITGAKSFIEFWFNGLVQRFIKKGSKKPTPPKEEKDK